MSDPDYAAIVRRAQNGDVAAFADLVRRFQDLAVGTAYSWFGEIEAARDAAQEAFLEAHQSLTQLREPAAFPGWFRQIVVKHCDRVTRRKQIDRAPIIMAASDSIGLGPEAIHAALEQARQLRFAVDALPPAERIVVALQYFAEASGAEVSAFLELPITTIKRRLRRARRRLRDEGERLLEKTIDEMRPSKTGQFAQEICFFIALRAGDRTEVARLLADSSTLVEAKQDWDSHLVHDGVLPFANKATPLITAIERGDLAMQTLLLDAGADVNGLCGCATGEAPVWAATLLNRVDHARQLLERGADPDAVSSSGNCALHLAAMRGLVEITGLLLEYGADPNRQDAGNRALLPWTPADEVANTGGKTPLQWAIANGHEEVAALLAGSADGAKTTLERQTNLAASVHSIVLTGIKALDLFAPLVRGGVIRFPFMAGVGMVVLLGELCQRFLAMDGGAAIWTGFTQPPFDLADWEGDMAEFGLADHIQSSLVGFTESPEDRREAFQRGLTLAESLRDSGHDVLAVILSSQGFENEVESSLLRLKTPSLSGQSGSITSIIVTPFAEQRDAWTELSPPYSGQIVLDRIRAQRYLFPAIQPAKSMSLGLDPEMVGERHVQLAEKSSALLEAYLQQDPGLEKLDATELDQQSIRAVRLLRYLCQPFATTEPFTGRPGEHVQYDELIDAVEAIIL